MKVICLQSCRKQRSTGRSTSFRMDAYLFSMNTSSNASICCIFLGVTSPPAACRRTFQQKLSTLPTPLRIISRSSHISWDLVESWNFWNFSTTSVFNVFTANPKPSLVTSVRSRYAWKKNHTHIVNAQNTAELVNEEGEQQQFGGLCRGRTVTRELHFGTLCAIIANIVIKARGSAPTPPRRSMPQHSLYVNVHWFYNYIRPVLSGILTNFSSWTRPNEKERRLS